MSNFIEQALAGNRPLNNDPPVGEITQALVGKVSDLHPVTESTPEVIGNTAPLGYIPIASGEHPELWEYDKQLQQVKSIFESETESAKALLTNATEKGDPVSVIKNTSNVTHMLIENLTSVSGMANQLSTSLSTIFGDKVAGVNRVLGGISDLADTADVVNRWTDSTNPIYLAWYAFNKRLTARIQGNIGKYGLPKVTSDSPLTLAYQILPQLADDYHLQLMELSRELKTSGKFYIKDNPRQITRVPSTGRDGGEDGTISGYKRISEYKEDNKTYKGNDEKSLEDVTKSLESGNESRDYTTIYNAIKPIDDTTQFSANRTYIEGKLADLDLRSDFYWNIEIESNNKLPNFPYTLSSLYLNENNGNQAIQWYIIPAIALSFNDISVGETTSMTLPRSYGKATIPANIKYPDRVTIELYDTSYYMISNWWKQYLKDTVGNPRKVLPIKDRCYNIRLTVFSPILQPIYTREYAVIPNIDSDTFSSSVKSSSKTLQIEFSILGASEFVPGKDDYYIVKEM